MLKPTRPREIKHRLYFGCASIVLRKRSIASSTRPTKSRATPKLCIPAGLLLLWPEQRSRCHRSAHVSVIEVVGARYMYRLEMTNPSVCKGIRIYILQSTDYWCMYMCVHTRVRAHTHIHTNARVRARTHTYCTYRIRYFRDFKTCPT